MMTTTAALWLTLQATITGAWFGPLEMRLGEAQGPIPTVVVLAQDGTRLTGTWRSLPPNTSHGTVEGTVEGATVRATITVVADAGPDNAIEAGRCETDARFDGRLTSAGILRLRATAWRFDAPARAAQGQDCAPIFDLVWTLQPGRASVLAAQP